MDSISTRIAGAAAVSVVVDDFYDRVPADELLLSYFARTDMATYAQVAALVEASTATSAQVRTHR